MQTALRLVAVAAVLVVPTLSAQALTDPQDSAVRDDIQQSDGEITPGVQLYIGRGDELSNRLRFDAAAREYARAAEVARREGHLPSFTSWKVATAYFYDGNLIGGAAALDQLASEAALVGDLRVEALAIYYAAWLDGKAGFKTEAAARIVRLQGLLRSQYMPVAVRDRLNGLLRASKDVAVELTN